MHGLIRYRSQPSQRNQKVWNISDGAVDITVGTDEVCLEWSGHLSTRSSSRLSLETTQDRDRWHKQVQTGDHTFLTYSPRPNHASSRRAQHIITHKASQSEPIHQTILKPSQSDDIHDKSSSTIDSAPNIVTHPPREHTNLHDLMPLEGSRRENGATPDIIGFTPQSKQYHWDQQSPNDVLPVTLPSVSSLPHQDKEIFPPAQSSETATLPLPATSSSTMRSPLEPTEDRWLKQVQVGDPTSPTDSPLLSPANSRLSQHEITRKATNSGVIKKFIFKSGQSDNSRDNWSNTIDNIPNLVAQPTPCVSKHSSPPNLKSSKGSGKESDAIQDTEGVFPRSKPQYQWIQQSINGDIDLPTYALLPEKLPSNLPQQNKEISPPVPAGNQALSSGTATPLHQAGPGSSRERLTGNPLPSVVEPPQQNKEIHLPVLTRDPAQSTTLPQPASPNLTKRQLPSGSNLPPQDKQISLPTLARGPAQSTETATVPHRVSTNNGREQLTEKQQRPLRLLAFDGGGVRGISSLYILKKIMGRIGQNIKPCDFFDLIAGTSTGGLIAIMLGRLRMSIEECIAKYNSLAEEIFTPPRLGRPISVVCSGATFCKTKFETVIKALVGQVVGDEEALLYDKIERPCPVFVLASPAGNLNNEPVKRFRSYALPHLNLKTEQCTIWQAARATSAAPTYFHPCTVDEVEYVDGGLLCNNPTEQILSEYSKLYGEGRRLGCLLSIGTGMQPNLKSAAWYTLPGTFAGISVDAESTHRRVRERFASPDSGLYFRFNAGKRTEDGNDWAPLIELGEYWKMDQLVEITKHYLRENQQMVEDCAKALSSITEHSKY